MTSAFLPMKDPQIHNSAHITGFFYSTLPKSDLLSSPPQFDPSQYLWHSLLRSRAPGNYALLPAPPSFCPPAFCHDLMWILSPENLCTLPQPLNSIGSVSPHCKYGSRLSPKLGTLGSLTFHTDFEQRFKIL